MTKNSSLVILKLKQINQRADGVTVGEVEKTMKKKTEEKKKATPVNKVMLTLYAFESEERKNCTLVRCSMSNGKDKDGDYLPSTPVTVIITKDTDNQLLSDDELTGEIGDKIYVEGSIKVEYNETKKQTYTNIKIFATTICAWEFDK